MSLILVQIFHYFFHCSAPKTTQTSHWRREVPAFPWKVTREMNGEIFHQRKLCIFGKWLYHDILLLGDCNEDMNIWHGYSKTIYDRWYCKAFHSPSLYGLIIKWESSHLRSSYLLGSLQLDASSVYRHVVFQLPGILYFKLIAKLDYRYTLWIWDWRYFKYIPCGRQTYIIYIN